MPAVPSILFNGSAAPVRVAHEDIGTLQTLSLANTSGVVSYSWTMLDKPEGSSAVLSSGSSATPTFTPDAPGTYLIKCAINGGGAGLEGRGILGVAEYLDEANQYRLPAAKEKSEDGSTGWRNAVNVLLRAGLRAFSGGPKFMVVKVKSGLTISGNERVWAVTGHEARTGYNGSTEYLPIVEPADPTDNTKLMGLCFRPDGQTATVGERFRAVVSGPVPGTNLSGTRTVGDEIYLDTTPGLITGSEPSSGRRVVVGYVYKTAAGPVYNISFEPRVGLEYRVTAKGDLFAGSEAKALKRLAVGADDRVLAADSAASTGVSWKALSTLGALVNALFTTKGSLITSTGASTPVELAVGADGKFLKANSAQASGLEWADATDVGAVQKSLFANKGYLITSTNASTPFALGPGSDGQILMVDSGYAEGIKWANVPADSTAVHYANYPNKGDLVTSLGSSTISTLPVGSDGQVLTVDSAQSRGIKWATPTATDSGAVHATDYTAKGSILTATAASTISLLAVGTDGQVLTADSSQAKGIKWTTPPGAVPVEAAHLATTALTDVFATYPNIIGYTNGTGLSTNTLRARPFVVGRDCTLSSIGAICSIGVGTSKLRVGIYESGSDGYPAALVVDSGEFDCSTNGRKLTTSLSIALKAGKTYWFAALGGTAAPNLAVLNTNLSIGMIVATAAGTTGTLMVGLSVSQSYGTLPSTFPADAGTLSTTSSLPIPLLGVS